DAEQKAFFARFGADIQNLIVGKLESVERRIEELAFQNWCRGMCRSIFVVVKLKTLYEYAGTHHEPFRFLIRLHGVVSRGLGELCLGCFSEIKQQESSADYFVRDFL